MSKTPIVFVTHAGDAEDFYWASILVESIRTFGGELKDAPVWVYLLDPTPELEKQAADKQTTLKIIIKRSITPAGGKRYPYSAKAFAAALAENDAIGKYEILAWLDADAVFVKEPREFLLPRGICYGYRPVMHKVIGSSYSKPPDEFWTRVYQKFSILPASIFPVTSPVDGEVLRAYFNAGVTIVRPEKGILRKWPECFKALCDDSFIAGQCQADQRKAIFLYQVALDGAVLSTVTEKETLLLPETYNYPFFWLTEEYPADKKPSSLDDLIMFRHNMWFSDPANISKLKDSSKIYEWFKARVPKAKLK